MSRTTLSLGLVLTLCLIGIIQFLVQSSLEVSNDVVESEPIDVIRSMRAEPLPLTQHSGAKSVTQNALAASHRGPNDVADLREFDEFESALIAKLRDSYGDRIAELYVQASLINVQAFVMERYSDDGAERFKHIIQTAFPDYAASIMSILERLGIYNEWLHTMQATIQEQSLQETQALLWEKRYALFGDDAEEIWLKEQQELSLHRNGVQARMMELENDTVMSLDEKLYQMQTVIAEEQAGSLQNMVVNPSVVTQAFFSLNSVQANLAELAPEARQEKISAIRLQSGFSEARVAELAQQDQDRNARWDNGLAYMEERAALVQSLNESELESALSALRTKYFKHEAITIEREEATGFLRYQRPRLYGVN